MNSLFLKKIEFESFRTFKDKQVVESLPTNGLIGILGKNLNTNGSNDSGKSNFHLSIAYALGYCPYPLAEIQSWCSNKEVQVNIEFETINHKEILIKRGGETSFTVNGESFLGARILESKIKDLINIPLNLFEALTFRAQGEKGRFLSMTGAEKRDFLATLLSLDIFETQITEINKKISNLENQCEQLENLINELKKQLFKPELPKLNTCDELQLDLDNLKLKLLENQQFEQKLKIRVNASNLLKETIKQRQLEIVLNESNDTVLSELLNELRANELKVDILRKNDEKLKSELKDDLSFVNKCLLMNGKEANKLDELNNKFKLKQQTLELLKQNKCINCEQLWNPEPSKEQELVSDLTLLEIFIKASAKAKQLVENGEKEREILNSKLINFKNIELKQAEEQLSNINNKISLRKNSLQSENLKLLNKFEQEKNKDLDKVDEECLPALLKLQDILQTNSSMRFNIMSLEQEITNEKSINSIKEIEYKKQVLKYNSLFNNIAEKEQFFLSLKNSLFEESDYVAMLKSFLGVIVQQVLEEIALEVNQTLKDIGNVNTVNISFNTESLTQKGILKQEIKPVFYKDGRMVSARSGLSGGQKTSVDLATDLAIIKVVTRRMGFSPGWLVLDEPFDGHDTNSKEACIEVLKKFAQDKLIFVIDHTTEIKEHFDQCINIECNNGISNIKAS